MYIDKLDDIVNKYNKTCHSTYIDFNEEENDKNPIFKVNDHVTVSKCKNIFTNGYTPIWSEEVFKIEKK